MSINALGAAAGIFDSTTAAGNDISDPRQRIPKRSGYFGVVSRK
jgi:hypothetical protein